MSIEMGERLRVVRVAQSWLGTPYHHHAALRGVGVDCAYLLIEVYAEAEVIPRRDPGYYPHDWHLHRGKERYLDALSGQARRVDVDIPMLGDIALYRFGRCAAHGAIVVGWPRLIHAYVDHGVIYANGESTALSSRFVGFYRPNRWAEVA